MWTYWSHISAHLLVNVIDEEDSPIWRHLHCPARRKACNDNANLFHNFCFAPSRFKFVGAGLEGLLLPLPPPPLLPPPPPPPAWPPVSGTSLSLVVLNKIIIIINHNPSLSSYFIIFTIFIKITRLIKNYLDREEEASAPPSLAAELPPPSAASPLTCHRICARSARRIF